jgi:hypothetical protein
MKARFLTLLLSLLAIASVSAQVYSNKEVGQKNKELVDSAKVAEYPYVLPIWGAKVTKMGFTLPYSAGVSLNYFGQESDLIINNLMVGFNHGPMYNLDEIVRFDDAVSSAGSISLRPDFWLFPFLNVYGIFGKAQTSTAIAAGIYVPDALGNWSEVTNFKTVADFDATTMGFGLTPTIGLGGGFMALDMNMAWTDISSLNKPAFSFVFGPRFGKSFKLKKKDSNISAWVGGFRVHMASGTEGDLFLSDLFDIPTEELQTKVDNGLEKVDDAYQSVNTWWEGLTEAEQKNPINQSKHETASRAIESASDFLTTMDGALNDDQSASVQYSLEKKPKDMWNFVTGAQYQLNRHLMFRCEVGFLGTRQQLTAGIQYRFGL